jgi:hypothetical protein
MIEVIKKLSVLLVIIATFCFAYNLANPSASYAVTVIPGCSSGGSLTGTQVCQDVNNANNQKNPVITIIKIAIIVISFVTGIASAILIVVSGIKFMTAGGDANKAASARSTLLYAVIGIFIVAIAQGLVAFVLDKLLGK